MVLHPEPPLHASSVVPQPEPPLHASSVVLHPEPPLQASLVVPHPEPPLHASSVVPHPEPPLQASSTSRTFIGAPSGDIISSLSIVPRVSSISSSVLSVMIFFPFEGRGLFNKSEKLMILYTYLSLN